VVAVSFVAGHADQVAELAHHRDLVDAWMRETHDPRLDPADDRFDAFPYHGKPSPRE
jgi:hypothetical protein